jgi:hypothetical protein
MTISAPDSHNDGHYLRHVTALGEKQEVVARQPIFASNGMKLVDVGARIDHSLYERLMQHKLLPAIDECVTTDNPVGGESLCQAIEARLLERSALAGLVAGPGERERLLGIVGQLPLPAPLAFKLTVAREQRPDLFQHALDVTIAALVLAARTEASATEAREVAAAALFLDIGLLHVDPALLDGGRNLGDEELHHLYSHPVIGHMILAKFAEWHPKVSGAVLEHHERLDGSGYPRSLAAESLGSLGQLLAVADLAATILGKDSSDAAPKRLSIILKLNRGKLNDRYAGLLTAQALDASSPAEASLAEPYDEVLGTLIRISAAIEEWRSIGTTLAQTLPAAASIALIDRRMRTLEHSLADVGVDLQYWAMVAVPEDRDADTLLEMRVVAREGLWQLRAIGREARKRWSRHMAADFAMPASLANWLHRLDVAATAPGNR